MSSSTTSSGGQRDLRIDFFRGLALVFIFIDHVPGNDLARLTLRNFGFADAAEVFVLLAGFSAVLAYGRTFEMQGFRSGTARVLDRVRDIYLWHLGLVAICAVGLTLAAIVFTNPMYVGNIGVHVFAQTPVRSTLLAATLVNQPNMLNILPLYIVLLMVWLPFVLWLLPRQPFYALVLSIGVWAFANLFEINLPSQQNPKGWVFNPFAWQLLITVGALAAHFNKRAAIPVSRALLWLAIGYVAFAFLVAAPWTQLPGFESARIFPRDMLGAMNKSYLSIWRLLDVVALGYIALNTLSPQSSWLKHSLAVGIARCGRHSLEVFCLGTLLSFAGWVVLAEAGSNYMLQTLVNLIGIGLLWGTAWALAQRGTDIGVTQALRLQFAGWRSQPQRA
jgi:hypothetical protein